MFEATLLKYVCRVVYATLVVKASSCSSNSHATVHINHTYLILFVEKYIRTLCGEVKMGVMTNPAPLKKGDVLTISQEQALSPVS